MPQAVVVKKQKDFFKSGEVIFKEGSQGTEMYIIKSGKVDVIKQTGDEEIILASLDPPAFFGEMALFGDPHRSATIKAAQDTQMVVITKKMLESQFEKVPDWFTSILKTLVERLRSTNQRIKSRFRVSFEFSILRILFMMANKSGNSSEDGYLLSYKATVKEICVTLGIHESEVAEKFKNLMFVKLIQCSEQNDTLVIPDMERIGYFNAFLRANGNEPPKAFGFDSETSDPTMKAHFEKIFKLLFRRKLAAGS
jgi:CRP-like cAMP-binding protein